MGMKIINHEIYISQKNVGVNSSCSEKKQEVLKVFEFIKNCYFVRRKEVIDPVL